MAKPMAATAWIAASDGINQPFQATHRAYKMSQAESSCFDSLRLESVMIDLERASHTDRRTGDRGTFRRET